MPMRAHNCRGDKNDCASNTHALDPAIQNLEYGHGNDLQQTLYILGNFGTMSGGGAPMVKCSFQF